jgi:hypothetical protein
MGSEVIYSKEEKSKYDLILAPKTSNHDAGNLT